MTKQEIETLYDRVGTPFEIRGLVANERRLDVLAAMKTVQEYETLTAEVKAVRAALDAKLAALEATP